MQLTVVLTEPLALHHVFKHRDVGGNIHRLAAEEHIELLFKGGDDGTHHALHTLHGVIDILTVHTLRAHAVIGIQELERGGQIVVHKFADLRQLFGVCLDLREDLRAQILEPIDVGRDLRVLDGIIQTLHLGDGKIAVPDHLVKLRIPGGLLLFRRVRHSDLDRAAHGVHNEEHHPRHDRHKEEMRYAVEREQQRINDPCSRRGIIGNGGSAFDGCQGDRLLFS